MVEFTILDKPYAKAISKLLYGLRELEVEPVIVGSIANQLNVIRGTAQMEDKISYLPEDEEVKIWCPELEIPPVIYAGELFDLEQRLRKTHDVDMCFPESNKGELYSAFASLARVADLGCAIRPRKSQLVIYDRYGRDQEKIQFTVDFSSSFEDSHSRLHRNPGIYNKTFESQRSLYLIFDNEICKFNYASPEIVAAAKLLRDKKKDREDIELLKSTSNEIDANAIREILDSVGEAELVDIRL